MMQFKLDDKQKYISGKLCYDGREFIFDADDKSQLFEHQAPIVVADTVSLEAGVESGRLLYLWGYSPRNSWQSGTINPPGKAQRGAVFIDLSENQLQRGVGLDVGAISREHEVFDASSGWLRIGAENAPICVEISSGTIVGLENGELVTVWCKPIFTQ